MSEEIEDKKGPPSTAEIAQGTLFLAQYALFVMIKNGLASKDEIIEPLKSFIASMDSTCTKLTDEGDTVAAQQASGIARVVKDVMDRLNQYETSDPLTSRSLF